MSTTLGKRTVRNAALSASTWFLPLVLSFLATPVLLNSLGHDSFGVYALVMGFVGYSFTFGIGKAAAKFLSEHRAAGSNDLAGESVSATLWFSLLVGLLGAVLIIALSGRFVDNVLLIPAAGSSEAKRGLLVAAGIILFTMLSQVWSFTLQGLHRFDRYAAITAIGSVTLNLGAIMLAWTGFDVVAILLWNLITTLVTCLLFLLAVRYADPDIRISINVRSSVKSGVLRYGGAIILSQVFGNLLLLIERSWITRNFGVEALTLYVVPMTLALFIHAFVGSIVGVLFPIINERLKSPERVLRIYRVSTKFVLAVSLFALPTVVVFGRTILTYWVGAPIADGSAVILPIHVLTFGMLASATVGWQVAESFGRARANALFSLAWLAAGTTLMVFLSGPYGLEGVAAARLAGCVGVIPLMLFVERRILGSFSALYWIGALLRLGAALGSCLLLQWLIAASLEAFPALLIGTVAGGTAYVGILLASGYFDQVELNWFQRTIRSSGGKLR